jgi:hypothetical protein
MMTYCCGNLYALSVSITEEKNFLADHYYFQQFHKNMESVKSNPTFIHVT